jgi:hypothetical protein
VEQGTHKPLVVGSNPTLATICLRRCGGTVNFRLQVALFTNNSRGLMDRNIKTIRCSK